MQGHFLVSTRVWQSLVLIGATVAVPSGASAQAVNVQLILPSASNMPRSIAAWQGNPAVIQVRLTNSGATDLSALRFRFVIRSPRGETAKSRNGQEPPFSLARGEIRSFLLEEIVNFSAVDYPSDIEQRVARDGIPEGAYVICVLVVDAANGVGPSGSPSRILRP